MDKKKIEKKKKTRGKKNSSNINRKLPGHIVLEKNGQKEAKTKKKKGSPDRQRLQPLTDPRPQTRL